jgi:hypothetical protein
MSSVPRPCLACGKPSLNGPRCEQHGKPFAGRTKDYGPGLSTAIHDQVLTEEPSCRLAYPGCLIRSQQVDHILNRARGGTDARSNLQGVCKRCHATKTAHEGGRRGGRVLQVSRAITTNVSFSEADHSRRRAVCDVARHVARRQPEP